MIKTSTLFVFSLFLFVFFNTQWAYAQPNLVAEEIESITNQNKIITVKEAEGFEIRFVRFFGNTRTRNEMVIDNMTLAENTSFSIERYETTLQNLKNLQVFVAVRGEIRAVRDVPHTVDVFIYLEEKWTLIPYLLGGAGGGSSYFALGLYDTNFLGLLHTMNFTYGCKNEICSTVVFYRDPRVWSSRANTVITAGSIGNTYLLYNRKREVVGAFSNRQGILSSYFDYELTNSIFSGFGFVYLNNETGHDGLTEGNLDANRSNNFQQPMSATTMALEGRFGLGSINYDGLLIDGSKFTSVLDSTAGLYSQSELNYTSINNTLLFYRPLPLLKDSYFAMRLNLSATNSDLLYMQYFVGGLDKIRGFFDNEYQGKLAWYGNAEFRIPSYVGSYVALQHVVFSDVGFAAPEWNSLWSNDTAVSVGMGVRLLFLKINRIAMRLDYAYTLNPFETSGLSFGLMQFF